ncbi:hypothetical protein BC939DRAFT_437855 [Gamsiella multidivaricata]|uniref:uncharacterized protein n=1 Tax=Gamsiella multidivaricata TaxID=101098 RepID=UPI00221E8019|nr:uncharacterized protein BC939DRAFT_437855 [Gamsiella multidivaricata]KAI7831183.1 hypothetical protein BC939DRAFT_437855 [Gamsiella multidivaricata]
MKNLAEVHLLLFRCMAKGHRRQYVFWWLLSRQARWHPVGEEVEAVYICLPIHVSKSAW